MLSTIYIATQILTKTKQLQRSTAKGKQALSHYETLVKLMCNNAFDNVELLSKRTKYGEFRIQNCVKYDLGAGYRLITIKNKDRLFIQFIGTHDEADSWLNTNKGFIPCLSKRCYPRQYTIDPRPEEATPPPSAAEQQADEYEERLLNTLDDKILQQIFCGLCDQR